MRLGDRGAERGATLLEFALLSPLLFLMMLALADFALAELSDTAGNNAAREGARVGILYYDGAHDPSHVAGNYDRIGDAVRAKLAGNVKGAPTVIVRCLNPNGTARPGSGSCSTVGVDEVDVGSDLIEVTVTWERRGGITGFIGDGTRTDKAVMRIVGTPPTGAAGPPPGTCQITSATATPGSVVHTSGTIPDVTFAVTVNDPALCGTPNIVFPSQSGDATAHPMVDNVPPVAPPDYEKVMMSGTGTAWTPGTKTATVTAAGGGVTQDITFDVHDPSVCLITGSAVDPPTVNHTSGSLASAITFTVHVSDAGDCGAPVLSFPAEAGYGGPQTMNSAGGDTFTFTMPTTQGAGNWSARTYNVDANAADGASTTLAFVVSDAPTCTLTNLSITPSSALTKKTGQKEIQSEVRITVDRSSSVACATPTVGAAPPPVGEGDGDLSTPRAMTCAGLTCEYVIPSGARNWGAQPSPRTVTITVSTSGSTVSGNLTLTQEP